ncbi:MAG TPA: HPF/RaiA family ribosome-associated protein [Polyangia bacterium]|nr:HPF/RaiA family ribosome-associated protein [Polyangia bacterium]
MAKRVGSDGAPARSLGFELHSPDMPLPPDVAEYVRDKLSAKLSKFGRRVMDVVVHFKDVNGDRGGIDKGCHMEAHLAGLEPVNVEERHEDLRAVIDIASERLEEAVHRHLQRTRTLRRDRGRRLTRSQKLSL